MMVKCRNEHHQCENDYIQTQTKIGYNKKYLSYKFTIDKQRFGNKLTYNCRSISTSKSVILDIFENAINTVILKICNILCIFYVYK